jgi:hypothetical protein
MQFSLVGLLPNVALSIEIEPDEVRVRVGVADSSDELAPDAENYVPLGGVDDLHTVIADARLVYRMLANQTEVGSIV